MKVNRLWVKSKLTIQIKHFAGEEFWCYSLLPGEFINGSENLENWEELWFFYSNFVNYLCLGDSFQRGVRSGLNTLLYRLSVVIHWMPKSDASWFPLRNCFPTKAKDNLLWIYGFKVEMYNIFLFCAFKKSGETLFQFDIFQTYLKINVFSKW